MRLKPISTLVVTVLVSFGVTAAQSASAQPADAAKDQASQSIRSQFVHWAKVRLDEIDATLTSLEGQVVKLQGEARAKADGAMADMRAKGNAFRETIQKEADKIETDWKSEQPALEADFRAFEAAAQQCLDRASGQLDQRKAAFQARAEAQRKAWREAIDHLQANAAKLAADNKAKADAALKEMNEEAAVAQAKLDKLIRVAAQSWEAYQEALAEARAAFDRANQAAHDAFWK